MGDWLKEKVSNFATNLVNNMKEALGIHSPSRVFRDQVGKYIALGVGEGFEKNIGDVYKQMQSAVNLETSKISANVSANTELKALSGTGQTIENNNDNGITVTQNFYEKDTTPYEQQKQAKQQLRRLAYGL